MTIHQYQTDPVAYVLDHLKEPVIMPHQAEILRALARGVNGTALPRLAVRCGQKTGMTRLAIWAALWFYECFQDSVSYVISPEDLQTEVMWQAIRAILRDQMGRDVIVSADKSRWIHCVNAGDAEVLAGLSGRVLFVVDGSLSTDQAEALAGNMMGGGAMLWISKPHRSYGPFFDCFGRMKEFWQTLYVNGEAVAMCDEARAISHVVSPEAIAEWAERYGGRDSPHYRIRVCGEFIRKDDRS